MDNVQNQRSKTIIRYNLCGILANLLLSSSKLLIGRTTGSRAVMLDGLNGFADMVSSLISIFSAVYARKKTDRKHPFGFGRMEYIASMFIAVFIVYMGISAGYGSVIAILYDDEAPDYNTALVVLMCISLAVKSVYGLLTLRKGAQIDSTALKMVGTETLGDSVISLAMLVTIAVYHMTGTDLEPWLSILISLFILKTGFEAMLECVHKLLGTRADPETTKRIKKIIAEEPEVLNVFNLVIHQYGEAVAVGSVDIEVEDNMRASEATKLTRRIIQSVAEQGVTLSSIGIYGTDNSPASLELWDRVLPVVQAQPEIERIYAFSYDAQEHSAFFLIVPNPSVRDKKSLILRLKTELERVFPGISFFIDTAITE